MPREYKSPTRDAIYALLERDGPMTAAEIAYALGKLHKTIAASIAAARSDHGTKYFRIVSYQRQVGVQGREAPVYGIGPDPDARRPAMNTPRDKRAIKQRYAEKNKLIRRARDRKRRGIQSNHFLDILGIKLTDVR